VVCDSARYIGGDLGAMKTITIKTQLRKLAKDFNLKYDSDWFAVIWIDKREEILNQFLSECEDPIYQKYGTTIKKRISNLQKFVDSKDYQDCIKRYGGSVTSKKEIKEFEKLVKQLPESSTKKYLLKYCSRTLKQLGKKDFTAFLTKTNIKSEKEDLIKRILRHEWIHRLLFSNRIHFAKIKNSYWKYDEGLNEYLGSYIDGTLNKLEKSRDKENYPYEKQYWVYAIKFRKLFEGKETPKERREVISKLMRELK
jgi:hypothetical protein